MHQIKSSLNNDDYGTRSKTDVEIDDLKKQEIIEFFKRLKEELIIGEFELFNIKGIYKNPNSLGVSAPD